MLKLPLRMRMRAIVVQWHPANKVCAQRSIVFEYSACFGVRNILELKWCIKVFRRSWREVKRKEEISDLATMLLKGSIDNKIKRSWMEVRSDG